ncbi:elongation factor P maturation arginine rhamnosyltransferase EarP [Pseudomonas sp. LRF_L74]|uniref:elongation factor P maturation arginine rhamnosyltransferase EarP n=1 Tax=Pseudomonas sp. LRF_L74 TaxID=3369422 RepID=UPI003F5F76AE
MQARWDIFCAVVDNYGDIGVTWRLARQLAGEHGQAVRLWVDELAAFARLCPQADIQALRQWHAGVEVCLWSSSTPPAEPGDVVVEAFACQLPEAFVRSMAAQSFRPLWLNLDYLSAEEWVEGCHGLRSPRADGLQKFFFFPGFTEKTGGLLREQGLLARRDAFQADSAQRDAFFRRIGVEPVAGALVISLFAYENAGLASWLDALAADTRATQLLVPEGRILGDLQRWQAGRTDSGKLSIQVLPFLAQDDYDRLLWSCDLNAVRGEDSFVRAQWAGRPMLWHIYPQEEGAHWAKLEAFLQRYLEGTSSALDAAMNGFWRAWNAQEDMRTPWRALSMEWEAGQQQARNWSRQQAVRPDLATALVQFHRNWLSCAA